MKKANFLAAVSVLTILCDAVGQTVKVPLTLDAWDTTAVKPVLETYKGK